VRKVYEERAKQEKEKYTSDLSDFCRNFPSEPIQRPRNHIKKPCNAYGYYLKQMKEQIRMENPEMRMCEVLRIVGEKWKNISAEEKLIHEQKAEASRKLFKEEVSRQAEEKNKKVKPSISLSPLEGEKATSVSTRSRESFSSNDDLISKDYDVATLSIMDQKESGLVKNLPFERTVSEKSATLSNVSHSPVYNNDSYSANTQFNNYQVFSEMYNLSNVYQLASSVIAMNNAEAKNKAAAFALESLYWKVEKLRQGILMQMQEKTHENLTSNVNNKFQAYQQMNQNLLFKPENILASTNIKVKEEYTKEEF
jgi:hypothetical protein